MIFGKATTDGSTVTTFDEPVKGGTKPSLEEVTYTSAPDAIKVFEPVLKDPIDQVTALVQEYEDKKNQGASSSDYVGAFDPKSDQYHVQTGNANVTQLEDLRAMFSGGPEISSEGGPSLPAILLWFGVGFLAFKLFKRGF